MRFAALAQPFAPSSLLRNLLTLIPAALSPILLVPSGLRAVFHATYLHAPAWMALRPQDPTSLIAILTNWWIHGDYEHCRNNIKAAVLLLPAVALVFSNTVAFDLVLARQGARGLRHWRLLLRATALRATAWTLLLILTLGVVSSAIVWCCGTSLLMTIDGPRRSSGTLGFSAINAGLAGWLTAIAILRFRPTVGSWWLAAVAPVLLILDGGGVFHDLFQLRHLAVPRDDGGYTGHWHHVLGHLSGLGVAIVWCWLAPSSLMPERRPGRPLHTRARKELPPALVTAPAA